MKRMSDGSAAAGGHSHFRVVMEFLEDSIAPCVWEEMAATLESFLGNQEPLPHVNFSERNT